MILRFFSILTVFIFSHLWPLYGQDNISYGVASFYAQHFHGEKTANGEKLNNNRYTAAHRTLPFQTIVKVTNTTNDSFVFVRINDRGPFRHGRIIDVTRKAAQHLDLIKMGIAKVMIEEITFFPDSNEFFSGLNNLIMHDTLMQPCSANTDSITHCDTLYYIKYSWPAESVEKMDTCLFFINFASPAYFRFTYTVIENKIYENLYFLIGTEQQQAVANLKSYINAGFNTTCLFYIPLKKKK